jgi:prolipoprotein diacylglyceryl transferase
MEHFIWNINPNIFTFGSLQLRWYGLLFVGSFLVGLSILQWIYKRENKNPEILDTLLIYIMLGAVIGARLMHCFAYEPEFYLSHPLEIFKVWKGGLASHGGLLGVLIALYLFSKKYKESFSWLLSRLAIPAALSATCIRIGNFFNSEIVGIASDKPWAIIFERIDMTPRHPVQLYEASAYFILFLFLILLYQKVKPIFVTKMFTGIFLITVFTTRFFLEYTKTRQAEYFTDLPFSVGQILSLPFIILGIVLLLLNLKNYQKSI